MFLPERKAARGSGRTPPPSGPRERFRTADSYRVRREWLRYEGTAQRDLFRELRARFLFRHAKSEGWVVDLGSGPGRFLPEVGQGSSRRVALDISREMLRTVPWMWPSLAGARTVPTPDLVLADALHPPLERGRWSEVVAFGNTAGFAGPRAFDLLAEAEDLLAPDGVLLLEIAPGPGERSRYLARLPPTSVARFLSAPQKAVLNRLDREGFRKEPTRREGSTSFHRFTVEELEARWSAKGWHIVETIAVAPLLGPDAERVAAVRALEKSWKGLLQLEEVVGRRPERWSDASAVLISVQRPSLDAHG